MKAITLLYHDAIEPGEPDGSGFPGPGPAVYKLPSSEMAAQFEALVGAGFQPVSILPTLDASGEGEIPPRFLTFDDGGISAIRIIAGLLESRHWVGHFFVTTGKIGLPAFLDREAIRELDRRGHVIGSHSHTHPPRISALDPQQLREEWHRSTTLLAELLGHPVLVASVPGGFYSRAVAEAAEAAGIRALFTSEPVKHMEAVGACAVLGRYAVRRGTTPEQAVALSTGGRSAEQVRQYLLWNVKKVVKAAGGDRYLAWRRRLLPD